MVHTMRLLLVEDDESIAEPLSDGLTRYGFSVQRVADGTAALRASGHELVLLDLGLPDIDGIDLCRMLRRRNGVPIIMITARGAEADRVVGLELGADDYLAKPFSLRELVARIRAVARRSMPSTAPAGLASDPASPAGTGPAGHIRGVEPVTADRRTREVRVHGRPIALTPKEFDLLLLLAKDPGAVVDRQTILNQVWDTAYFGNTRTLDVHVASLRRKLGDPALIETVRGIGFRLATSEPATSPDHGSGWPRTGW